MDRIRTHALGDPSDPKARMVPLYHGSTNTGTFKSCSPKSAIWQAMMGDSESSSSTNTRFCSGRGA
ncbi:hypothetical protein E2C01_019352 [Portunus trituberculatus]|uniref:Uncharacterized protein n=1 Tax=Portunus trituberculatus TaxID=210409 RepID=A0A5B7DYT2_PORTR|nr:hypothetical protein [Portunus trituberculatus]